MCNVQLTSANAQVEVYRRDRDPLIRSCIRVRRSILYFVYSSARTQITSVYDTSIRPLANISCRPARNNEHTSRTTQGAKRAPAAYIGGFGGASTYYSLCHNSNLNIFCYYLLQKSTAYKHSSSKNGEYLDKRGKI